MNRQAFARASGDLARAREHFLALKRADGLAFAEAAWSDFLIQLERAVVKLGLACSDGVSSSWFGQVIRDRRNDPLLAYVKNARDADHHGVEPLTERQPASQAVRLMKSSGPVYIDKITIDAAGNFVLGPQASKVADVVDLPPWLALRPVVNRGRRYEPPESHLGEPIRPEILGVAAAALSYAERRFREADAAFPA